MSRDILQSTEDSITSGLQAAQAKLGCRLEKHNDLAAESEALTAISELGYKRARLAMRLKTAQEEFNKTKNQKKNLILQIKPK